jgi:hypothetical protein
MPLRGRANLMTWSGVPALNRGCHQPTINAAAMASRGSHQRQERIEERFVVLGASRDVDANWNVIGAPHRGPDERIGDPL